MKQPAAGAHSVDESKESGIVAAAADGASFTMVSRIGLAVGPRACEQRAIIEVRSIALWRINQR